MGKGKGRGKGNAMGKIARKGERWRVSVKCL